MTHEVLEKNAKKLLADIDSYNMVQYPIYIPSKARPSKVTAQALEDAGLNYFIVVEPQDYTSYREVFEREQLIKLPMDNQ